MGFIAASGIRAAVFPESLSAGVPFINIRIDRTDQVFGQGQGSLIKYDQQDFHFMIRQKFGEDANGGLQGQIFGKSIVPGGY